jgi:DeoR/GlpR family transcriptional regulator of sugar metabolism
MFEKVRSTGGRRVIEHEPHIEGGRGMLAETRRLGIVQMLRADGSVSVADIEARFGVSSMTARRDLAELERQGSARRTHGGAVLLGISGGEDSFGQRVERDTEAKAALAAAAVRRVTAGEAIFLDSSSTTFFVAREILESGLAVTLLTNSLPIMDLVASQARPNVELIAVGGVLRGLTQSFVGPQALQAVQSHFADRLFFSCKGVTSGVLTDADQLEAELKRAMIAQAAVSTVLVDRTKLAARGLNAIAPANAVDEVITHGFSEPDVASLRAAGVTVELVTGGVR